MRLIDADVLDDAMYHEAFENDSSYDERNPMARWDSGLWIRYKMFENAIADAPTIDIVFCKECKHFCGGDACNIWFDGIGFWETVNPDDFCSYGERKESE